MERKGITTIVFYDKNFLRVYFKTFSEDFSRVEEDHIKLSKLCR